MPSSDSDDQKPLNTLIQKIDTAPDEWGKRKAVSALGDYISQASKSKPLMQKDFTDDFKAAENAMILLLLHNKDIDTQCCIIEELETLIEIESISSILAKEDYHSCLLKCQEAYIQILSQDDVSESVKRQAAGKLLSTNEYKDPKAFENENYLAYLTSHQNAWKTAIEKSRSPQETIFMTSKLYKYMMTNAIIEPLSKQDYLYLLNTSKNILSMSQEKIRDEDRGKLKENLNNIIEYSTVLKESPEVDQYGRKPLNPEQWQKIKELPQYKLCKSTYDHFISIVTLFPYMKKDEQGIFIKTLQNFIDNVPGSSMDNKNTALKPDQGENTPQ